MLLSLSCVTLDVTCLLWASLFPTIEVQDFTSPFSGKELIPTQSSPRAVCAGNMSYLPALESGDSD